LIDGALHFSVDAVVNRTFTNLPYGPLFVALPIGYLVLIALLPRRVEIGGDATARRFYARLGHESARDILDAALAHPRLQALLAEFADGGTRLKAGVEWDADGCRRALGGALTAGRLALALLRSLIPVSDRTRAWHAMSVAIVTDASAWVHEEIQRMRTGDPA
jgi:hypothetical protein